MSDDEAVVNDAEAALAEAVKGIRKHPEAHCEACPLLESGLFVPSDGPAKAKIAYVGEAAGRNEVNTGKPFTGQSGKLLDQINGHHKIKRKDIFLSNATLCRPAGRQNTAPPASAVAACRPRLVHELRERGVETVVALGNVASQSLLGSGEGVSKLRVGFGKDSPYIPGVRVLPTFHPAACVHPATRVLTSDLRWIPAGDLEVGQELIGFDEDVQTDYQGRHWRRSEVTTTSRTTKPVYKVTLEDDSEIVCSDDHMWLVEKYGYRTKTWITTKDLAKRTNHLSKYITWMHKFVEPWDEASSREAGYLAGWLDGEGHVHPQDGVGWGQVNGETADYVAQQFKGFGFEVGYSERPASTHPHSGGPTQAARKYRLGGRRVGLRALGMFRPVRLLPKASGLWEDKRCRADKVLVTKVEYIGEEEVVVLNTSTRTYIAEGFMSHNCLRSPDFFPSLVRDIGKINRKHTPWQEPAYKVFDDPDSAIAVLKELIKHHTDRLVIDIETDTDKDEAYDHPNNYELLCIGIGYEKGKVVVIERNALKDPGVIVWLRKLLTCGKKLGPLTLTYDSMLYSYAKDERRGIHSLATQGIEILGTPDWKDVLDPWEPKKNGYSVIPVDVLDKYNAFDVSITWDLIEYYQATLSPDLIRDHDHRVKASNELVYVELNGIAIDMEYNSKLMTEYLDRLAPLEERMQEVIDISFLLGPNKEDGAGYAHPNFNPRSPQQVQRVLQAYDVHVIDTREATLKLLTEKVPPDSYLFEFLQLLLKHRREAKLYGTYVKGIRKRLFRGRVYPTFLLHGTTTGRLACRNPNLQNIPRQSSIRAQFVPSRPGRVFVQCDYSQAELRVLTWLAQEEYFRVIFNDDTRDLFNELTPVLYGNVDGMHPAARKEKRIRVKAYVYGLSYGREAGSIAGEFRIPVAEAAAGMEAFFGVIPNVVTYQKEVWRDIKGKGVLATPFGRRRRFPLVTDDNFIDCYKEGLAFRPQSISSDICLRAFYTARPALKGKALIRNIVHDSILAECEEKDADYVSNTLNEIMLQSAYDLVGDYVAFKTDATVGASWGEL
jgi:uracil-DNA glycosylase family 4